MAEEIQISELELADELLQDMVLPVETATDTKAATLLQLKKWLGSSLPTGFILPAIGRIDDARFTLLDGKTLSRTGTYEEFCNKVIEQVQLGNWFACSQSEYDEDLNSKGQCGRFVIEDDYVRIPTITRYIGATVTLSEFGQAFNESLPNITGSFELWKTWLTDEQDTTGAFEKLAGEQKYTTGTEKTTDYHGFTFNASRVSSTYQDGAKVNVEHVKYPYYMVISTEGQSTPISVDINNVHEDINLKANKDLSDVTQIGKETVVGWGMPDYSSGVSIPVPTSEETYTAPSAGIYFLSYASPSSVSQKHILVNGYNAYAYQYTSASNSIYDCLIMVDKDDVISSDTTNRPGDIRDSIFYPVKGVNNV